MGWQEVVVSVSGIAAVASTCCILGQAWLRARFNSEMAHLKFEREQWIEQLGPLSKIRERRIGEEAET